MSGTSIIAQISMSLALTSQYGKRPSSDRQWITLKCLLENSWSSACTLSIHDRGSQSDDLEIADQ